MKKTILFLCFVIALVACEDDKKFVAKNPEGDQVDLGEEIIPDEPFQGEVVTPGAQDPSGNLDGPDGSKDGSGTIDPVEPVKEQTGTIVVEVIDEAAIKAGLAVVHDCELRVRVGHTLECDLNVATDLTGVTFASPTQLEGFTLDPATGKISWTPTADQVGTHDLLVVTLQGPNNSTTTLVLEVYENSSPSFGEFLCETETPINQEWRCASTASDPDDDPLTYNLQFAPAGMTIDDQGLITWTPSRGDLGFNIFKVTVSDGELQVTEEIVLRVIDPSRPPVLNFVDCPLTVEEDSLYECQFELQDDAEDGTYYYWLKNAPLAMDIDQEAMVVTWFVPNVNATTKITYTVVVDTGTYVVDEGNVFFATPRNDPPALRFVDCAATVNEDQVYRCGYEVTDPDGDPVTVSLTTKPTGMTLNTTTQTLTWTVPNQLTAQQVGITLTAGDGKATSSQSTTVTALPLNDLPTITFLDCPPETEEDVQYECGFTVRDIDGNQVDVTLVDGPEGMILDQGRITWLVPEVPAEETMTYTLAIDDGTGVVERVVEVLLLPVNDPPVLTFTECPADASEDTLFSCFFEITDEDGDLIEVALGPNPTGMTLDLTEQRVTWTVPNILSTHDEPFRLVLDDGHGTYPVDRSLTVWPVNDAPSFHFVDCTDQVREDDLFRCTYEVTDLDGDLLSLTLIGAPTGMTLDTVTRTITWTVPETAAETEISFSVQVSDGTAVQTYQDTILTLPANDLPVITLLDCPTQAYEDSTWQCSFTVSDGDSELPSTFLAGAPAGMTLDANNNLITWVVPNIPAPTTRDFELVAQDQVGEVRRRLSLELFPVNDAPVLTLLDCQTTIAEDETWLCGYEVSDLDGDPIEVHLDGNFPAGMSVDEVAHLLTWRAPNTLEEESYTFELFADDGSLEDVEPLQLTVSPVNDAPVLTFLECPSTIPEDANYVCTYQVIDPDGDELTVTLQNPTHPGITLVAADTRVIWDTTDVVGTSFSFQLRVSDPAGAFAQATRSITVLSDPDAPVITFSDCPTSIAENEVYECHYQVTDGDGDQVDVTLAGAPAGMTLDQTARTIHWTVPETPAEYELTYQVVGTETTAPFFATTISQSVTVLPVNDAPTLAWVLCPAVIAEDETLTCTFESFDVEGDSLTFALLNDPAGMVLDVANSRVTWTVPNLTQPLTMTFQLSVTDGDDTARISHTLTANPVNDAPTVTFSNCAASVDEDQTYSCTYAVADPDGDMVAVSLTDQPEGMRINEATRQVLWTVPNTLTQQTITYQFLANDGTDLATYAQSFTINPVNDPPSLNFLACPATILEDAEYRCTYETVDLDGDAVTVSLVGAPAGMTVDQVNRTVLWTAPNVLTQQTFSYQAVASDGQAQTSRNQSVSVLPVNDPPVIAFTECAALAAEDSVFTCRYEVTDLDGNAITSRLTFGPQGMTHDAATRTLTWTVPNVVLQHEVTFEVAASDGQVEVRASRSVTVTPVNDPPTLTFTDCPATVPEDQEFVCRYTTADIDGNALTVVLFAGPDGMSHDPAAQTVRYRSPRLTQDTPRSFTLTVDDATVVLPFERSFTVLHVNHPPVLAPIGDQTVETEAILTFTLSATDQDGDALTFSVTGLPNWATFDQGARTITLSPFDDDGGLYPGITVTVSDGEANDSETFSLIVASEGNVPATQAALVPAHTSLKTDILFVMETSGSKSWITQGVGDNIERLIDQLELQNEFQVALLLAHDGGRYAGRLYAAGGNERILTRETLGNFQSRLTSTSKSSPDGGDAGLFSLNKALDDLLAARAAGTVQSDPDLVDLDRFFRPDAGLTVIYLAEENDICYRTNYSPTNPYGDDTDSHLEELPAYLRDCFPSALPDADKTLDRRNLTVEAIYDKLVAVKGDQPINLGGIFYKNLEPGSPYYVQLGLGAEDQTGRGYKQAIKYALGDLNLDDADPDFNAHLIDLLSIKLNTVNIGDGMEVLGGTIPETEIEILLEHAPVPETLSVELTAVDGVSLPEPVLLIHELLDAVTVQVTIPVAYYFSELELALYYEYQAE